jgi:hypothetical protein
VSAWYKTGSIESILLQSQIKEFDNTYGLRLQTIQDDLEKMQKEYFVFDESGQQVYEGSGNQVRPKFQDGKTQEQFQEAFQKYMDEPLVGNLVMVKA